MNINTREAGGEGEEIAVEMLTAEGYEIIERNYAYYKVGEIDIIAKDPEDNYLVFIEVKTRKSLNYGEPEDAITKSKKRLYRRLAAAYLFERDIDEIACRFDVIAIMLLPDLEPDIRHYKNAF